MSDHYNRRRSSDAEIVALRVEVDGIKSDVHEMRDDIKGLLALANQTKGGWRVILLVAGVAGTAGAMAAKVFPFLMGLPK